MTFSEWVAGIIEARFRESIFFCEQIGHRSFVIIPHEMSVKKVTANMMITYYEFQILIVKSVFTW